MKIADFGLCRDVHLKGYYRKTTDVSIHTHYTLFSYSSFCHPRPQIAKARRGGRRGKVTAIITDDIVK